MKNIFLGTLFCYVLFGCIKVDITPRYSKYSIYSVITPSDSIISVFVAKTYKIGEGFPVDSGKYVRNAIVKIKSDKEEINLILNDKNKNYEAKNLAFLKFGRKYELSVFIGDEKFIASSIIPEKPLLQIDKKDIVSNQAQVSVSWKKSTSNNAKYRLFASANFKSNSYPLFYWDNLSGIWKTKDEYNGSDKIIAPLGNFNFIDPYKIAYVDITLQSLDENWFNFQNKIDALRTRTEITKLFESPVFFESNISNALGLFGSYSSTTIETTIIK